jgi:hypothetical protein
MALKLPIPEVSSRRVGRRTRWRTLACGIEVADRADAILIMPPRFDCTRVSGWQPHQFACWLRSGAPE